MRTLALFIIGTLFGAAGGFLFAAANGVTLDGHDHGDPVAHGMSHDGMSHGDMDHAMMHDTPIDVDAATAPSVAISVTKDPMAGYNLHVMTENFTFDPQNASNAPIEGSGHAHVYADGVKLGRLYGPWMHLDNLPEGTVEITVTLNSNDHRPLAVNGKPVSASMTLSND